MHLAIPPRHIIKIQARNLTSAKPVGGDEKNRRIIPMRFLCGPIKRT
jgi:hypothetical protein